MLNFQVDDLNALLDKLTEDGVDVDPELKALGVPSIWEFVKSERVPQESTGYDRYGRLVSSVIYVKVPAGKLSVVFGENLVTSIEQTEGAADRDARVKLVPAPLVFAN